jgi:midasin
MSDVDIGHIDSVLDELKLLATNMASDASLFKNNPWNRLDESLKLILELVTEVYADLDNVDSSSPLPRRGLDHHAVKNILTMVKPAREYLYGASIYDKTMKAAASAWLNLGLACLFLYVPDQPYDPALRQIVLHQLFIMQQDSLTSRLSDLRAFESKFTGQTHNWRIGMIQYELDHLGTQPENANVLRPNISQLDQIQGEYNSILSITNTLNQIEFDILDSEFIVATQSNISELMRRLNNNYRAYDDLLSPATGFLSVLQIGLQLTQLSHSSATQTENQILEYCKLTPFLGSPSWDLVVKETHPTILEHDLEIIWQHLRLLEASRAIHYGLLPNEAEVETIQYLFGSLYSHWKKELSEDQKKAAAQSSLYTYRGSATEDVEEEDHSIFPDYEQDAIGYEQAQRESGMLQSMCSKVTRLHDHIFHSNRDLSKVVRDLLGEAAPSIYNFWCAQNVSSYCTVSPSYWTSLLYVILDRAISQLQENSPSKDKYNFYFDPNLKEASRLVELVGRIQTRFQNIREAWPEQSTLGDVLQICSEAITFAHTEPIAKFLTKAEKLHITIYEWQSIASKEYSVSSLYDELTSLIVSWRQLELSTWARLLDAEMENCEDEANAWFFVAYEAVVMATESVDSVQAAEIYAQKLLETLEGYILNTTLGQYKSRLRLIRQMRSHLLVLPEIRNNVVANALTNFIAYYDRFQDVVNNTINSFRKPLENDLKDIIRLASWKDTNIQALRQSAKTSHRKLSKAVRKFREKLNQPVHSFLNSEITTDSTVNIQAIQPDIEPSIFVDESADEAYKKYSEDADNRPTRVKNAVKTASTMRLVVENRIHCFSIAISLKDFIAEHTDLILRLSKQTPSQLTEKNKEYVKDLARQKRKTLKDILEYLKRMGIKRNLSTDTLSKQDSLPTILASTPPISNIYKDTSDADLHLHRILQLMPQARGVMREHSSDLSTEEVIRCLGYLEGLLELVLNQRRALANFASSVKSLNEPIHFAKSLWNPAEYQVFKDKRPQTNHPNVQETLVCLEAMLTVAGDIIEAQERLGNLDFSPVLSTLQQLKVEIKELLGAVNGLPSLPLSFTTSQHEYLREKVVKTLPTVAARINECIDRFPTIESTLSHVLHWATVPIECSSTDSQRSNHSPTISGNMETMMYYCIDKILISMQRWENLLSSKQEGSEGSAWFKIQQDRMTRALDILNVNIIIKSLYNVIDSVSNGHLIGSAALLHTTLPILLQYQSNCQTILSKYSEMHATTAALLAFLSHNFVRIGKQGFCTPPEKTGGDQNDVNEKLEAGTGLGEGEGAEDISKDIQDDEDLEDLAQQPDQGDKQDEIDDEKDAVNMDGQEMEGQMGDREQEESSNEGADSEEDDNIEDEVGDVDDLGPDTIDEKLWDESGNEDSSRKESEKGKGTVNENEKVAAQEQEESDAKDKQNDDITDGDEEMAGAEEAEQVDQGDTEQMDPHVQESEKLDFPDDMGMDDESALSDNDDAQSIDDSMAGSDDMNADDEADAASEMRDETHRSTEDEGSLEDGEGEDEKEKGEDNEPDRFTGSDLENEEQEDSQEIPEHDNNLNSLADQKNGKFEFIHTNAVTYSLYRT